MTVTPLIGSLYSPENIAGFFEQQDECSLYACLLIGNFRIVHYTSGSLLANVPTTLEEQRHPVLFGQIPLNA